MIQPKVAEPTGRPRGAFGAHAMPRRKRARRAHARRIRYAKCIRVLAVLAIAVAPVMVYVMLTSNLTGLNYAISQAQHDRAQIQDDVQQLDDRIAHLESRERLQQIAIKLGMREPQKYEIVSLPAAPQPRPKNTGLAFLEWLRTP